MKGHGLHAECGAEPDGDAVAQDYGIVPLFQRHSGVFPCAPESVGVHEVQPESLHVFVKIQKIPD